MTLKELSKKLEQLPRVLAQKVAEKAAGKLTDLTQASYDARQNPYGVGWAGDFDLVETGTLKSQVRYRAIGTRVQSVLGTRYARYHASKVLPGKSLPTAWTAAINDVVSDELKKLV